MESLLSLLRQEDNIINQIHDIAQNIVVLSHHEEMCGDDGEDYEFLKGYEIGKLEGARESLAEVRKDIRLYLINTQKGDINV